MCWDKISTIWCIVPTYDEDESCSYIHPSQVIQVYIRPTTTNIHPSDHTDNYHTVIMVFIFIDGDHRRHVGSRQASRHDRSWIHPTQTHDDATMDMLHMHACMHDSRFVKKHTQSKSKTKQIKATNEEQCCVY